MSIEKEVCLFRSDCGLSEQGRGCCGLGIHSNPKNFVCEEAGHCNKRTVYGNATESDVIKLIQLGIESIKKPPPMVEVRTKGGCSSCADKAKAAKEKKDSKLGRIVKGGTKLLKAELGIDRAETSIIETRKDLCTKCDHFDFGVCKQCGCYCAAKIKLKHEKCPVGKW